MTETRTNYFDKRKSGIDLIGDIPWGTSLGQFYENRQDLLEILIPYFQAGLENNELCVWITSDLLNVEDSRRALSEAVPDFARYLEKGHLEIIPQDMRTARSTKIENSILAKLDMALSHGFEGLRLVISPLPGNHKKLISDIRKEVKFISRSNAIAVFTYHRDEFDAIGLMEAAKNHRFVLVRNVDKWELIESSEARVATDILLRSEEELQSLFSHMAEGFAYHRIMLDEKGQPVDYIFLEVNNAFEKMIGLQAKDIVGKRVTQVLPGIENDSTDWISRYGKVALTGKPAHFESYSSVLQKWYSISAFSPRKGFFAVTFNDITAGKQSEQSLKESEEKYRAIVTTANEGIWVMDSSRRTTYVNDRMAAMLGYTSEEMMAMSWRDLIDEKDQSLSDTNLEKRKMGIRDSYEFKFVHKNGSFRWVIVNATPQFDSTGKFTGIVGLLTDITERKQAEEKLKIQNQRLKIISESNSLLLSSMQPENIVRTIAIKVMEHLHCDCFFNFIVDPKAGKLRLNAYAGIPDETAKGIEWLNFGEAICGCAARDGCRIISENIQENGDLRAALVRSFGIQAYAAHPLMIGSQTIGTLSFGTRSRTRFTDDELDLMKTIAGQVSVAMERKLNEESLQENRKQLQDLIDGAPNIVYMKDLEGRFITINRRLEELLGKTREWIQGKTDYDIFPEDWAEYYRTHDKNILEKGRPEQLEEEADLADGQHHTFLANKFPLYDMHGKPYAVAAISTDISERKQMEARIQEQLHMLEQAQILVRDMEGKIIFWNQGMESLYGYTKDEAIGKLSQELLQTVFPQPLAEIENEVKNTGRWQGELVHTRHDGVKLSISSSWTYYQGDNHKSIIIESNNDITGLKQAEEALERYTRELETSNKELESFSYSVSHDLRAPLRTMDGFSQALLEDYAAKLDSQGQEWLTRIRSASQKMALLIDDILGLSRVVRAELRIQKVNLSELVEIIFKELQDAHPERHINLLITPGLQAYGDLNLLKLALTNLLSNAFKFTSRCRNACIEFGFTELEGQPYYFIRDNGAGFDMAYSDKLFKAFQRLHSEAEYPGTGIGLATVQRIIRRHGGKIYAKGEVDKGAIFYFSLGQEGSYL